MPFRNYLWNASYQILLILAPLVTIPYISRVLGPELVGIYSYTFSIANYFVIFATLGMAQYGVREIAKVGGSRKLRTQIFWSAWAAQLSVAIPVFVAYLAYALFCPAGGRLVALIWGLWVLSSALDISWLFFGVEEFRLPTIRSFVTKLLGIAFIFAFCKTSDDLWAYVMGLAGAFLMNSVLLWPFVKKYVDFSLPRWKEVRIHYLPNLRLFAPVVAISLYVTFDKILLGAFSGMEQSGIFEYSDKISRMPLAIVTALGTVMLPHMTSLLGEGEERRAISLIGDSLFVMEIVALGLSFGIAAIAPEFVPIFFGKGFEACVVVMPAVAAAIPLIAASNVVGVQYLLPLNRDSVYTKSVCIGAAINLVFCLLLLKPFGAAGAAFATVMTEAAVLVYQCSKVRGELPLARYVLDALPFVVCGLVMLCVLRLLAGISAFDLFGEGIALVVEIFVGIVIYSSLGFLWCWKSGKIEILASIIKH